MFTKEEIFSEVAKIQYLYGLKREIRYEGERAVETESVAEHIYAMQILAQYFLELENPSGIWNRSRIYEMITWHDIDELETGDMIGYKKTEADREREVTAMEIVLEKLPTTIKEKVFSLSNEYQKQETIESRFVKAIDKIEPIFHLYNENGKEISLGHNATYEQHRSIKDAYVVAFPYINHFNVIVSEQMKVEGFFTKTT